MRKVLDTVLWRFLQLVKSISSRFHVDNLLDYPHASDYLIEHGTRCARSVKDAHLPWWTRSLPYVEIT